MRSAVCALAAAVSLVSSGCAGGDDSPSPNPAASAVLAAGQLTISMSLLHSSDGNVCRESTLLVGRSPRPSSICFPPSLAKEEPLTIEAYWVPGGRETLLRIYRPGACRPIGVATRETFALPQACIADGISSTTLVALPDQARKAGFQLSGVSVRPVQVARPSVRCGTDLCQGRIVTARR